MKLAAGIAALSLDLPVGAEQKLVAYLALLAKWNKVYNLTAIRDPGEMVTHHLLDSLATLPALDAWRKSALAARRFSLADVGSGAGLPGLVLAIVRPEWIVCSIESVDKKAAFQRQAVIELGLANVSIHCGRVQHENGHFDAAIARAYASLADMVASAGHLADTLWAMKGGYPAGELAALPPGWRLAASHELKVPGLAAERHVLQLEKN